MCQFLIGCSLFVLSVGFTLIILGKCCEEKVIYLYGALELKGLSNGLSHLLNRKLIIFAN